VKEFAAPAIRASRASDLAAVRLLLDDAQLPTADLASAAGLRFWVLEARDELIGAVAWNAPTAGLWCARLW
jgi:hypothetical protein